MACTHQYDSVRQVGSQHLARQFLKDGWTVYYISAPMTPLHLAAGISPEIKARWKNTFSGWQQLELKNLYYLTPFSLFAPDGRPVLRSALLIRYWHHFIFPLFHSGIKKPLPDEVDLLYIDNIFLDFLLEVIHFKKSVFRVADIHHTFPGWGMRTLPLARKIAQQVDLTVYAAAGHAEYVNNLVPKQSLYLPNGVDYEYFAADSEHPPVGDKVRQVLDGISRPIVLYTGAIDERIDFDLIVYAAKSLPHISFVFIGPVDGEYSFTDSIANIHLSGSVSHHVLPWFIKQAVIGIIPFSPVQAESRIKGTNPLKMLEYLACGLPVLSYQWPEVERVDCPVFLYKTREEFVNNIIEIINSDYDSSPCRQYARKQSWINRYNNLKDVLFSGVSN